MSEIAVIGDYDIRDRKLADETSKSSVATTDSIRMKDTDGNEVYIVRDSFVDAVRSALGPILTNMTQKTAASDGVLVNDSNDVGTMNLSNLASVLSVAKVLGEATATFRYILGKGWNIVLDSLNNRLIIEYDDKSKYIPLT